MMTKNSFLSSLSLAIFFLFACNGPEIFIHSDTSHLTITDQELNERLLHTRDDIRHTSLTGNTAYFSARNGGGIESSKIFSYKALPEDQSFPLREFFPGIEPHVYFTDMVYVSTSLQDLIAYDLNFPDSTRILFSVKNQNAIIRQPELGHFNYHVTFSSNDQIHNFGNYDIYVVPYTTDVDNNSSDDNVEAINITRDKRGTRFQDFHFSDPTWVSDTSMVFVGNGQGPIGSSALFYTNTDLHSDIQYISARPPGDRFKDISPVYGFEKNTVFFIRQEFGTGDLSSISIKAQLIKLTWEDNLLLPQEEVIKTFENAATRYVDVWRETNL